MSNKSVIVPFARQSYIINISGMCTVKDKDKANEVTNMILELLGEVGIDASATIDHLE
jgi:hypothetical protein